MGDREELAALRRLAELEARAGGTTQAAPLDRSAERKAIYEDVVLKRGWGSGFPKFAEELGGKISDLTGSPAAGAAANTAVQAIPMAIGGNVTGAAVAPVLGTAAQKLMHSALKPQAKDILSGDAAKAIDTLLRENANISVNGAVKLRGLINKLESEVSTKIAEASKTSIEAGLPPVTVDKAFVASEIAKELKKFGNQVNPNADVKAVLASWDEFKNLVGNKIPIEGAHSLKKGTYRLLADKYAKQGTVENVAGTQSQMAMARGLRLGEEAGVPGLDKLTARESSIINALEMVEKRSGIGGNKDVAGIAWLANNPAAAAAMMADRSSAFKSWLANKILKYRQSVPAAVGAWTTGVYQGSQQVE